MIDPREFLDDAEELHALVIGIAEVLCFWPSRFTTPSKERAKELAREYHYYQLGRITGFFVWFGLIGLIIAIVT